MTPYYQKDNIAVYQGDAREVLPAISVKVDHVVTDPPYGLSFMEAGWDQAVPGPEYWQASQGCVQTRCFATGLWRHAHFSSTDLCD